MELIFVGADHEVTGSCHFLNVCGKNILVDYGMRQGTQTYENIEIILVNDGSYDESPLICDEYKSKDSRIKVIHKKNGGLSDARNAGIRIASGDYITFD